MFCLYLHKDTERMNFNSSTTFMFFASVDAHAPPLFPSSECNAHFGNLFKCHKFPDMPKHIHRYSEGGIELDSRHPNPHRIYVSESLVEDVCR